MSNGVPWLMPHNFRLQGCQKTVDRYTRHCFKEGNNQCAVYRISVRNEGTTTINNVAVKILALMADQQLPGDDLRRFMGLRLCVSINPFGMYSHPDTIPDSTVLLHPGDEATFDFV